MKPTLSFAVVTRNRPESLERALRSLRSQSEQPWEVVISDDSDITYRSSVERIAREFDCRYLDGPRRGLYANRNSVALACRGSHIRSTDDDHTFPDGHIAACANAIESDPAAVWIIGECLPSAEATGVQYYCPGQLHPRGYSVAPPIGLRIWAIADGATLYPRKVFDEGNRLYEGFVFGASYLEWGSRLHWLGYDIRHLSSTYVIHHVEGRSYNDEYCEVASRIFAGLAHSFVYQPSIRNRILVLAEMSVVSARLRASGVRAVAAGVRAFRAHRQGMREANLIRIAPSAPGG